MATISLAVEYQNAVSVLMGTTLGMLVADGIGIGIGVVLCKRIPQRKIKWFSAIIFVLFGMVGIYEVLIGNIGLTYTALTLAALVAFSAATMLLISKRQSKLEDPKICKRL